MTGPFSWAQTSTPAPAAEISRAEAAAWRQAYKLAEANPGIQITVWRSRGEFLALRKGQAAPSRARSIGTVVGPLEAPQTYSITHPDGRVTWHTLPAAASRAKP